MGTDVVPGVNMPVGIVRLVPSAGARTFSQVERIPRVLFAVGSRLTDRTVRPGAEFMGIIRHLERHGGSIQPRVLDHATRPALVAGLADFQPDVLHLIGHGQRSGGEVKLADWVGDQLLDARALMRGGPFLVVLQAGPIDDTANVGLHDDLADKVQVATELMTDDAQAVLLLPTLPATLTRDVFRAVLAYANAPLDNPLRTADVRRLLLRPLRGLLAPYVQPEVLDNIILFLNSEGDS
jgi:hypothetical protein